VYITGFTLAAAPLLAANLALAVETARPREIIAYARVPAGRFQMGCVPGDHSCAASESPRHAVAITHDFWMMKTDVTVAAYKIFSRATGRPMPKAPEFDPAWSLEDHPIVSVTWDEATAYCAWAGARLPTEAEWEYAARAGQEGLQYPWGNEASTRQANYDDPGGPDDWPFTAPVACYPASGDAQYDMTGDIFGLYDMAGNVWQWCADAYDADYYARSSTADPKGPAAGRERVLRGGSWYSVPQSLRTSYRHHMKPDGAGVDFGFRCVRDHAASE
jgi:formylglycine-generating enzyme required for sulfatase activity